MSFLNEDELNSLEIRQSVFHIVGPKPEHFQLLCAFEAGKTTDFFLGRVRSVNGGNRYVFQPDSPVRTQLRRILRNRSVFQHESEKLATAFNDAHGGSAAVGAFLIFELGMKTGRMFALLKFEDEKVLSYDFDKKRGGRPIPTFGELNRTFVQNRNALQKAALIRIADAEEQDGISLVDRQSPIRPALYFEQFLRVRRLRTEDELTTAFLLAAKKIALRHKDDLPEQATKALQQKLFDASQSEAEVDGDAPANFLASIIGPLPANSSIQKEFLSELKREGLLGESFTLRKGAFDPPRNRRVETAVGIKITFPASLQSSVINVNEAKGEITIHDKIIRNDAELEQPARVRS